MKKLIIFILALPLNLCRLVFNILSRKKNRAYMISTSINEQTGLEQRILYSPYFEHRHVEQNDSFTLRIVATYGAERLPKGYLETKNHDFIDRVFEMYFLNDSGQVKSFTPIALNVNGGFGSQLIFNQETLIVQPKTQSLCNPVLDVDIPFATEIDTQVNFRVDEKNYSINAVLKRLTNEDLSHYR